MNVIIEIPDSVQSTLEEQFGADLPRAAKEALAIAWYQSERLSIGQVAEMLGISVYEAEGLMKSRGIDAPYSLDDYQQDQATLNRLLKK